MVTGDYDDSEEIVSSFKKALEKFGINVYDSPVYDPAGREAGGDDPYVLYLTKNKLSKSQLKEIDEENIG